MIIPLSATAHTITSTSNHVNPHQRQYIYIYISNYSVYLGIDVSTIFVNFEANFQRILIVVSFHFGITFGNVKIHLGKTSKSNKAPERSWWSDQDCGLRDGSGDVKCCHWEKTHRIWTQALCELPFMHVDPLI